MGAGGRQLAGSNSISPLGHSNNGAHDRGGGGGGMRDIGGGGGDLRDDGYGSTPHGGVHPDVIDALRATGVSGRVLESRLQERSTSVLSALIQEIKATKVDENEVSLLFRFRVRELVLQNSIVKKIMLETSKTGKVIDFNSSQVCFFCCCFFFKLFLIYIHLSFFNSGVCQF